jgi:hypothetical protein
VSEEKKTFLYERGSVWYGKIEMNQMEGIKNYFTIISILSVEAACSAGLNYFYQTLFIDAVKKH